MAIVLAVQAAGPARRAAAGAGRPRRCPSSARWSSAPGRARRRIVAVVVLLALVALPFVRDEYAAVLATDIVIAALFAASLQFLLATGGMTSFGHAAYFGVGAYAAALAVKAGWPMLAALAIAPVAALARGHRLRLVLRAPGRRLPRDADARVRADRLVDRVPVGQRHRRLERPRRHLAAAVARRRARASTAFALAIVAARAASRSSRIAHSPFGLRAARRARFAAARRRARHRRARTQWRGFALAGAFAGLAGGLFAFSKGSISPESLAIPRSVDALVMVLLGGLNALFGPLLGAAAFTWLADTLARAHRILARAARRADPAHRAACFRRASAARAQLAAATRTAADERRPSSRSRDLAKAFGGVRAVDGVSFRGRAPANCVALIGPNGAGKTTCFNLVNGQLAPDAGTVALAGAAHRRPSAAGDRAARRRPHVPGRGDVRVDDGARERRAGAARACGTRTARCCASRARTVDARADALLARVGCARPRRRALRDARLRRRQARRTRAGAGGRAAAAADGRADRGHGAAMRARALMRLAADARASATASPCCSPSTTWTSCSASPIA